VSLTLYILRRHYFVLPNFTIRAPSDFGLRLNGAKFIGQSVRGSCVLACLVQHYIKKLSHCQARDQNTKHRPDAASVRAVSKEFP
jgi:hypothetical protein